MAQTIDQLMQAICEHITQSPVTVKVTESPRCLILELHVVDEHRGRVIGREGRTIESLRTIARAMGAGKRAVFVELYE